MIQSSTQAYREVSFKTRFGVIRGCRWGESGGIPVLALHGWLDNCATFATLAPLLQNIDLVAIDLPGHAQSDFRSGDGPYNLWQDIHELYAVLEQLGWQRLALLGHSRGAMVSFLFAGAFPERVSHYACLDALWPMQDPPEKCPENLAASILANHKAAPQRKNYYDTFDAAVFARRYGFFNLPKSDAEILAKRGVIEVESRYYWRYDPNLLLPSEIKLTAAQIKAFMARISVPILLLKASEGILSNQSAFIEELKQIGPIYDEIIEGGHHFHLSEQTHSVAERLNHYFSTGQ